MKPAICSVALVLALAGTVTAQSVQGSQFLSITFVIDGKKTTCPDLKVSLRFRGREIVPEESAQGFIVPAVFQNTKRHSAKVAVNVVCGEYHVDFVDLDPSWVKVGSWEFGIAYPPYWSERFGWTRAVEHGTWISYLLSECNDCDPGVLTTVSHATPPDNLVTRLKYEQSAASGQRARDIAYALAVFGIEYQRNRNYLVQLLDTCLSRPKESGEDEVCDRALLSFVTNLYWRGDNELLQTLLQIADYRRDVIGGIGYFYGDLLERNTAAAVGGMTALSAEKQRKICAIAGEDDFSINQPKFQLVAEKLHALRTEVATRCLKEAEGKATPAK